ncbi:hypothetical protein U1Q18_051684, partial [Sarracenia purpurea var. burkii]
VASPYSLRPETLDIAFRLREETLRIQCQTWRVRFARTTMVDPFSLLFDVDFFFNVIVLPALFPLSKIVSRFVSFVLLLLLFFTLMRCKFLNQGNQNAGTVNTAEEMGSFLEDHSDEEVRFHFQDD